VTAQKPHILARLLPRFAALAVLLAVWQLLATFRLINVTILPAPLTLLRTLRDLLVSGEIWLHIVFSMKRVIIGFGLSLLVGVSSGVLLGISRRTERYLSVVIELLRPIPPIAWIPIAILWFGIGDHPAYFIVAVGSFFPIFVNTFKGIRFINRSFIRAARCLGATRWLLLTDVIIPNALPYMITGVRVGIAIAWTSLIAAELVGAQSGLGYMIQLNRILLRTDTIIIGMALIGVIGYLMNLGLVAFENRVLHWVGRT
jgi:ABC-type nitrate/sulfonate/bicarbonate transport system permease component